MRRPYARAWIYDRLFYSLSRDWYRAILSGLPEGSRVLDVGVGTGSSLISNADLVREREMKVEGIDINESYLKACQEKLEEGALTDVISVRAQSVYDLDPDDKQEFAAYGKCLKQKKIRKAKLAATLGDGRFMRNVRGRGRGGRGRGRGRGRGAPEVAEPGAAGAQPEPGAATERR